MKLYYNRRLYPYDELPEKCQQYLKDNGDQGDNVIDTKGVKVDPTRPTAKAKSRKTSTTKGTVTTSGNAVGSSMDRKARDYQVDAQTGIMVPPRDDQGYLVHRVGDECVCGQGHHNFHGTGDMR